MCWLGEELRALGIESEEQLVAIVRAAVKGEPGRILRLEAERRRLGISKAELARRAGMNAATVCEATTGKRRPGQVQLARLALAIDWKSDPIRLLDAVAA